MQIKNLWLLALVGKGCLGERAVIAMKKREHVKCIKCNVCY